jgi:hypothetical protein
MVPSARARLLDKLNQFDVRLIVIASGSPLSALIASATPPSATTASASARALLSDEA